MLGSATGVYKTLVKYLVGVPEVSVFQKLFLIFIFYKLNMDTDSLPLLHPFL